MSNETNRPPEPLAKPRRPFWRKKRFLIPVALPAALLATVYFLYFNGKPRLTVSPETTVFVEPTTPDGKSLDFRRLFDEKQDAWLGNPQENGYRELLAAFGPRILAREWLADSVRWEDFPTDSATKDWFAGDWTQICAKFELDPTARPAFFDRLDLSAYLRLNGIDGNEKTLDEIRAEEENAATDGELAPMSGGSAWFDSTVSIAGEERPAKASLDDALDCEIRVQKAPWTADDFPVAARWLDENADVFELYAKAIDAPRFAVWRFSNVADEKSPDYWLAAQISSGTSEFRKIARYLQIRANFRLGSGDVDGAISDRRLILRLARRLLDDPNAPARDALLGIALFSSGAFQPLAANPNALPTAEQLARDAENRRETFGDFDFDAARNRALETERFYALATAANWRDVSAAEKWKLGAAVAFDGPFVDDDSSDDETETALLVATLPGLDVDAFARRFNAIWDDFVETTANGGEFDFKKLTPGTGRWKPLSPSRTTRSELVADRVAARLLPAQDAFCEAYRRAECVANLAAIQSAILRYQAENGTLPPAFTVDENGTPLQSWRVLVLPHLGDEAAKALFAKIRLDESWDSEFNRQFWTQIPDVYRCPSNRDLRDENAADKTAYSVIVGENALFDASGTGKNLADIARNPEKNALGQALIVERKTPVCWTRPDAELDENAALASPDFADVGGDPTATDGIAAFHNGGVQIALANGTVQFTSYQAPRRFPDPNATNGAESESDGASFFDLRPANPRFETPSVSLESLISGVLPPKKPSPNADSSETDADE